MDKWLDLLTPSAAALAILFAIALVIQSIRHGRALRRLESRVTEREGAGARVSLDRLRELQRRPAAFVASDDVADTAGEATEVRAIDDDSAEDGAATEATVADSDRPRPPREPRRPRPSTSPRWQPVAAVIAVLAVILGTSWYLFIRDDDTSAADGPTTTLVQEGQGTSTTRTTPRATPADELVTTVPATAPQLAGGKGAYTIKVVNGSGVTGAAANLTPRISGMGYETVSAGNTETQDVTQSFVAYVNNSKIAVAQNVAKDLELTRVGPLDGVTLQNESDSVGVDAIVVIGNDALAQKFAP